MAGAHRRPRACPARSGLAGGWLRVFLVGLFAFHIAFVRLHLLTETHLDHRHAALAQGVGDDDGHEESDEHNSHPDSDHLMQLASQQQPAVLAAFIQPPETQVGLTRPDAPVVRVYGASWKLPGASPPDPLQPRAPPLA